MGDKLIHDGDKVVITNDGATVMRELQIQHPAARLLADISKAQDDEVGDGTTSVVVFAGELLREAKRFLEDGLPPQTVTKGFRKAAQLALGKLHDLAYDLGTKTQAEEEDMGIKCAETTLNSKLISGHKTFFAEMVTKAVMTLGEGMPLKMIGIKKLRAVPSQIRSSCREWRSRKRSPTPRSSSSRSPSRIRRFSCFTWSWSSRRRRTTPRCGFRIRTNTSRSLTPSGGSSTKSSKRSSSPERRSFSAAWRSATSRRSILPIVGSSAPDVWRVTISSARRLPSELRCRLP